MEPLTAAQIREAPMNVLLIQKKMIPMHMADLHAALDEAMMTMTRNFEVNAHSRGMVQINNSQGLPIIGGVFRQASIKPKGFSKKYKGKKVICEMPCCTIYHPVPTLTFTSTKPLETENLQNGWIKVESRSKRNKRLRAMKERKLQNEYLYSQDDEFIE
jgi:hypothetical protein